VRWEKEKEGEGEGGMYGGPALPAPARTSSRRQPSPTES